MSSISPGVNDKATRAGPLTIKMERGEVFLPKYDTAWRPKFEAELLAWTGDLRQPSDQIDDTWKLDGAVDDVQLMAVVLLRIADGAKLPEWNKGDEFAAARKQALESAAGGR